MSWNIDWMIIPFRTEREKYYKHGLKAKQNPTKYLSITIDGMDQAKHNLPHFNLQTKVKYSKYTIYIYYIDRSVLLVKFIRNFIREPSGVFSISSQVRILMASFPVLSRPFGANSRWKIARDRFVYIIKRKLHGGLKIWIFINCVKSNILLTRAILFLPHSRNIVFTTWK